MMTNKKLIFRALTILTLLVIGFFAWKLLIDKPDFFGTEPPTPTYGFVCPDGSHHRGIPSEGVQEWCEKHGFVVAERIVTVSGYVISGGDTTPEGLFGVPRRFVYTIQTRGDAPTSSIIDVSYIAYPPSPVGGRERKKIRLDFYAGTIKIGDYLEARGTYDAETELLTVANEGDYIETYPEKQ